MKPSVYTLICILSFITSSVCHPTRYPHVEANKEELRKKLEEGNPPPILSWHIHITYFLTNQNSIDGALAIREAAAEWFAPYLGPECDGRYDYGYLCIINDHNFENETLQGGPFPVGEWSIFVPVPYYSLVIPWMIQHRGDYSLVVHPNTGFENEDHSSWASWTGQAQPLDMSIFTPLTQTNEEGEWRGDSGNPTCMPESTVCGNKDPAYNATTTVLCCENLSCACDTDDNLCRCS